MRREHWLRRLSVALLGLVALAFTVVGLWQDTVLGADAIFETLARIGFWALWVALAVNVVNVLRGNRSRLDLVSLVITVLISVFIAGAMIISVMSPPD